MDDSATKSVCLLPCQDQVNRLCRHSLDVASNTASIVGMPLLALRADSLQVVTDESVPANRAPIGSCSQRADDACPDKDGQVEAVL